ncbi:homeodomain-like protein [Tanacetum coccineum]
MTRSRKDITKVFTPFANPERQFHRKDITPIAVHNMYSFYESESSESESADLNEIDIETLTLEQYLAQNHNNSQVGVNRHGFEKNIILEIKSQLLRKLRENTFSGGNTEDATEHVRKILKIASLFNKPGISGNDIMLQNFPLTLIGSAKRCQLLRELCENTFSGGKAEDAMEHEQPRDSWEELLSDLQNLEESRLGNPRPVNMVIEMADRSMQSPKGIVENVLVKIHKFIFPVDFVILDIVKDNKVPIILRRPMLATAHARIDVFGGKISLEVGKEQVIFNVNEGATPVTVSPFCAIKDFDDNNIFLNYEDPGDNPASPNKSPSINWNPVEEFQDSDDNLGIRIDIFIAIDDLWDNLDPGSLMNKQPLKPEFLSTGNRVNRYNLYNLQITYKIGFFNFNPYIDPISPFNIMSRAGYNSIIKRELIYTGNNIVGNAKNLQVFIGCHSFLTDFMILENVNEFVEKGLAEVHTISGIRGLLGSFSCGSKVLSRRNHIGILGETRLFYRRFARIHLLQSSFEEESNAQGNLLF